MRSSFSSTQSRSPSTRTKRGSSRSTSSSATTASATSSGARKTSRQDEAPLVALVGAPGFTGGLTRAALRRRGLRVRPIGRNPAKLANLGGDPQAVPAWDAAHLADALEGCAAVVSCAGPFLEAGRPVVEAVLALGLPYCDSTGEQEFIRWVFEQDAEARRSGAPLVPAFRLGYVPGGPRGAAAARGP